MAPPTVGYWQIRGLAQAIRLLLHYKEVEFEDSREDWLKEKFTLGLDFPNIPYYIDGDLKITETSAIFAYLGRKYDLSGSTEEARIRNDIIYSVQKSHRTAFSGTCYNKDFETLKGPFLESLPCRLEGLSKYLGDYQYFGGSEIVYSDFCVYDFLDTLTFFSPGCLDNFDNLKAYVKRIESLPTLAKFLSSKEAMRRGPFNNRIAHWGDEAM